MTGEGASSPRCVGQLHLAPVVTVSPDTTLAAAARIMTRTGAAFVTVEGTDRVLAREDVVRAFAARAEDGRADDGPTDADQTLDDNVVVYARSSLLIVGTMTPAIAVLGELVRSGGPGVIVVDERRQPCGALRMRDLVAALLDDLALLTGLRHVLHVETLG